MAKGNKKSENSTIIISAKDVPLREAKIWCKTRGDFYDLFYNEEDFKQWALLHKKIFTMINCRLDEEEMGFLVKIPFKEIAETLKIKSKRGLTLNQTIISEFLFMKEHSKIINTPSPLCSLLGYPKQLILNIGWDEEYIVVEVNRGYKYYFFEMFL